ncbi:hypothetical protein PG984_005105 [Apiospora sp. TS-2023a]
MVGFDNLGRSLEYNPLPAPVIDKMLGQRFPPIPAHLSRVLFVPKHNSTVGHLPIYEVTDVYRKAVKDATFGSHGYRVSLWFMHRPKGDGTDEAEVCFFINNQADHIIVEQRCLNQADGTVATINLPTGRDEPAVIIGPGQAKSSVRVSTDLPTPSTSQPTSTSSVGPKDPQYPTMSVETTTGQDVTKWKVWPVGPGSACYHLVRCSSDASRVGADSEIAAIYQHAGPHLTLPVDHSEGIMLVPEVRDPQDEILLVAIVVALLWYVRELNVSAPARTSSLSKMLGHLRIGKGNRDK